MKISLINRWLYLWASIGNRKWTWNISIIKYSSGKALKINAGPTLLLIHPMRMPSKLQIRLSMLLIILFIGCGRLVGYAADEMFGLDWTASKQTLVGIALLSGTVLPTIISAILIAKYPPK